jgi:hypothetical protein
VKYRATEDLRHQYPLPRMCRLLGVSTSGYYAWCHRGQSMRVQQEPRLEAEIREAHRRTGAQVHKTDVRTRAAAEGSGRARR